MHRRDCHFSREGIPSGHGSDHAYRSFDENLRDLEDLRRKKHRNIRRILSLWRIPVAGCTENRRRVPNYFSAGIHRPEVVLTTTRVKSPIEKRGPTWANEVVRLREAFLPEQGRQTTNDEGKNCKQRSILLSSSARARDCL